MPFNFDHADVCQNCPYGGCSEDRRVDRVRGRDTQFRFKQRSSMHCTFDAFMPGTDNDPDLTRTYDTYLNQFRSNALTAGNVVFGSAFDVKSSAIAKVEGDVFELLEAGALWAATSAWNNFMDTGIWNSQAFVCPPGAVATPTRKMAIVKLPRGYDATRLFKPEIRAAIQAHESALRLRGMELGLSSPDIVGVRLPYPLPPSLSAFMSPVADLTQPNLDLLESAHRLLEDKIDATGFLLAIAVKRTTRSDRLYQPLFESNILKYLIEFVLRGAAFRFYAHLGSFDGADVVGRYRAASLISLIRGGTPGPAVDALYHALRPRDSAQSVINDFPLFPI